MNLAEIAHELRFLQARVRQLQEQAFSPDGSGDERPDLPNEVFEALASTLEKLRIAEEKLRPQDEAPAPRVAGLEAERQRYNDAFDDSTHQERTEPDGDRREAILEAVGFAAEQFLATTAWEQSVQAVLAVLGQATGASRVYIFENHIAQDGTLLTSQRYEWVAAGVTPQIGNPELQNFDFKAAGFERWVTVLSRGEIIHGLVDSFPRKERELLASQNILSIVVMPIFVNRRWWGFIGFDNCLTAHEWSPAQIEALRLAARTLGAALHHNRMEEALAHERDLLHTLMDTIPDFIYFKDSSSRFTRINRAHAEILGLRHPADAVGRTDFDFFTPEHAAEAYADEQEIIRTGRPLIGKIEKIRRADGEYRWVSATKVPIRSSSGRIVGTVGISRDITELTQAEAALRESEERYRTLVETSPDAILLTGLDGTILMCNQQTVLLQGYERAEELLGVNFIELIVPEDRERAVENSRRALELGRLRNIEYTLIKKDGSRFPAEVSASVIRDSTDQPTALISIIRDITERKQAEQEIRTLNADLEKRVEERTAQLQAANAAKDELLVREQMARAEAEAAQRRMAFLAEASTLLSASLDYETTLARLARVAVPFLADLCFVNLLENGGTLRCVTVTHVDPGKEQILRVLQGRAPGTLSDSDPLVRVLRTGKPQVIDELPDSLVAAALDNETREQIRATLAVRHMMVVPLVARRRTLGVISLGIGGEESSARGRSYGSDELALAGELARRVALAVDNARLYQEAQEAIRDREAFLSVASHELKTPLTALKGYTELLQRRAGSETGGDKRNQRAVRAIYDQAVRLQKLVELLLDLSRIQTGQLTIEHDRVDICALVSRVSYEIQPTLTHHTLQVDVPDEPLLVDGDALRLEQVIQNLLNNAIKYSPEGGPILVSVEPQDQQVVIRVTDKGIGIPADLLPQLFERFYRVRTAKTRRISGMGLGLFVVKEIVTLHGGEVDVQSQEGEGSTFSIRLPRLPT